MDDPSLIARLACGLMAGGVASFVATPVTLVRCRLQAQSHASARAAQYKGFWHALRTISGEQGGGVRSLWTGSRSAVARACVVTATEQTTFEYVHCDLGVPVLMSGVVAGAVTALASIPLDTVQTRLMTSSNYGGVVSCIFTTCKTEGVLGLYRGSQPYAMRQMLWTIILFVTKDVLQGSV